jgi:hypothetical protein
MTTDDSNAFVPNKTNTTKKIWEYGNIWDLLVLNRTFAIGAI